MVASHGRTRSATDGPDARVWRGRRILVTGGSGGIGREIAHTLAAAGAVVLLPVRDRTKGERIAGAIRKDLPDARIEVLDLDLARLDTVAALVSTLRECGEPIEALVLNAGIIAAGGARPATADGFEPTFQTNHLGHAALTLGLLPLLRIGRARVVVQGSAVVSGRRLRRDRILARDFRRPIRAYRASKIALGMFGLELHRRSAAGNWGISVQLCHPGVTPGSGIAPGIRSKVPRALERWFSTHLGNPPATAAQTAIAALAAPPSEPRMYGPAGFLGMTGPPRERAPFPSLVAPDDARWVWEETVRLLSRPEP